MRVGIVCEGVHDFPALAILIQELADRHGLGTVSCHPLQPNADASSKSGDGGWPKVVAWCQANAGQALDTYLRAPLFAGEDVFDLIVIHLDGDIAHECAKKFSYSLKAKLTVDERVSFLSKLVTEFVSPPAEATKRLRVAIPTQKTESWMLAGLSLGNHDWENVEAKALLLAESGFREGRPGKAEHYVGLANRMKGLMPLIESRCRSFEIFANQFA